ANGSTDAGSIFGVDPIHVERNVVAGGAASGDAQSFFGHRAHAALIDIAHGVDLNAGLLNVFLLAGIDVAHTYQHAALGPHFGRKIEAVGQLRRPKTHDRRQRHTVDVAAG